MSHGRHVRLDRARRHVCLECRAHRARFRYRGVVRADDDHTLCFRCFRAASNRLRARLMKQESGNLTVKRCTDKLAA